MDQHALLIDLDSLEWAMRTLYGDAKGVEPLANLVQIRRTCCACQGLVEDDREDLAVYRHAPHHRRRIGVIRDGQLEVRHGHRALIGIEQSDRAGCRIVLQADRLQLMHFLPGGECERHFGPVDGDRVDLRAAALKRECVLERACAAARLHRLI